MNKEIESALETLAKANKAAAAAGSKVFEKRLLEISTALTDIADALEKDKDAPKPPDHMAALVAAIKAIKLAAPEVSVSPTIEVRPEVTVQAAAPTVNVDVSPTPIQNHNNITVPPAAVTIHERAASKVIHVEFEYVGDRIFGAKITRE